LRAVPTRPGGTTVVVGMAPEDDEITLNALSIPRTEKIIMGSWYGSAKAWTDLPRMCDLYLAGAPLLGRVTFVRGGHELNRRLLSAIFSEPANWERSTCPPASGTWAGTAARVAVA